jgi:cytochrome c-type biogenesis protein CcmH
VRSLAVALAALALAPPAAAAPNPAELESELVCPVCETTLDQSDAPVARRMKSYIRERIAAGASEGQIKDELVAQFGPAVLAEPAKEGFDLLAWALPLAAVVAGAGVVGALVWRWSRTRDAEADAGRPLDPDLERRLDEELARFED